MKRTLFTLLTVVLSSTSLFAAPIRLQGTLSDGGERMRFVHVKALDARGDFIEGTVSNLKGSFSLRSLEPIGAVLLTDVKTGRSCRREGPWSSSAEVAFDFAGGSYFRLRGSIAEHGRILLQELLDSGAKWSGQFDHVARMAIRVTAYAGDVEVSEVHPDERGRFALQVDFPISRLVVASVGGVSLETKGPWSRDATVRFSTSGGKAFTLRGRVLNEEGAPRKYASVVARDARGREIATGTTGPRGAYLLRVNRKVARVEHGFGHHKIVRKGPWSASATVDLRPPSKAEKAAAPGAFRIRGRLADENGAPLSRVRVTATGQGRGVIGSALSDRDGRYEFVADRPVLKVFAYRASHQQQETKKGSWTSDSELDFQFGGYAEFTLSGVVKSPQGRPAAGLPVRALDHRGKLITETRSDSQGRFQLTAKQPVSRVQAMVGRYPNTLSGPWDESAEVTIKVSEYSGYRE